MSKLKVEIWSDIMCPFCYIGKRKFETALNRFPEKDSIEIEWKSFQLSPDLRTDSEHPQKDTYDYVAEKYGNTREWSIQMHENITQQAKESGLDYHFENAIIANTFDAHRLIHLAKSEGLGDELEEALFKAYFTEGKDVSDIATLTEIGLQAGLNPEEIKETLHSNAYSQAVRLDIEEAQQIGVRGVPFFVFDRKYAVSGAQSPDVFSSTLETVWKEWEEKQGTSFKTIEGNSCSTDGKCD